MKENRQIGIDIGGTGIKAAVVDVNTGEFLSEKIKYKTPAPYDFEAISSVVKKVLADVEWSDPVGIGFPAIVRDGHTESANNINKSWLNFPAVEEFNKALGLPVYMLNDADAAGLAEQRFCKEKFGPGTTLFMTIGTGIGSALFRDDFFVPNTEMGDMMMHGGKAEHYCSNKIREKEDLSWKEWASRFNEFLVHLRKVLGVDQFILGGGISRKFDQWGRYLDVNAKVRPAELKNNAGIIGAALFASRGGKLY